MSYAIGRLINHYTIDAAEFRQILEIVIDNLQLGGVYPTLIPILMQEFTYALIGDSSLNEFCWECPDTPVQLNAMGLPIEQFHAIRERIYKFYLNRHIAAIEGLVNMWREHIDVTLRWSLVDNDQKIIIHFRPKPGEVDIDRLVAAAVDQIIETGGFVPYKYLRAIGRL